MLPDKAVKEFQEIYERRVGEKITFEEAKIKAENFLRLTDLITKPNPKQSEK